MIWQNLIPGPDGGVVQFFPKDIDPRFVTSGESRCPETVMYLTLHADTAGGVVQQNNSSHWTQPPRPGDAALALDADRHQHRRRGLHRQ